MVQLVARLMTVLLPEGRFPPGAVLPESAKSLPQLADLVRRGRISVMGDAVTLRVGVANEQRIEGVVVASGCGHQAMAGWKPSLLEQLFRRGQLVAVGCPAPLAAAVCGVAASGKIKLVIEPVLGGKPVVRVSKPVEPVESVDSVVSDVEPAKVIVEQPATYGRGKRHR